MAVGYAALTTRHPSIRKNLALTSPTSDGFSVGIVPSRIKATELLYYYNLFLEDAGIRIFLNLGFCLLLQGVCWQALAQMRLRDAVPAL
jgi:hypothetical protein